MGIRDSYIHPSLAYSESKGGWENAWEPKSRHTNETITRKRAMESKHTRAKARASTKGAARPQMTMHYASPDKF